MAKFKVGRESAGTRSDIFISEQYPEFSRSSLEGLFGAKKVLLNNKPVKGAYKTRLGDVLEVDDKILFIDPPEIDIPLIHSDKDVLVLNKPAGVLTHSKGALNTEATVASFIKPKLDRELTGNRAGIVHRLDRGTSGVIITAKNKNSLKHLQKQFSERKTDKKYVAIVEGTPLPREAIIDAPIARNQKKPQTFKVSPEGKSARTKYKVLKEAGGNSLLEITPETGRTHQIRVHLAYIGHPVSGDNIYGHSGPRMFLHAASLTLDLPGGKKSCFTAPLPEQFNELIS